MVAMLKFNATKWNRINGKDFRKRRNLLWLSLLVVAVGVVAFAFYGTSRNNEGAEGTKDGWETAALVPPPEKVIMKEERPAESAAFMSLAGQKGTAVLIEKKAHKLTVLRDGERLKEYGIAVGKNGGDKKRVGDMRTPEGSFSVQQIQNASGWTHDFRDGKGAVKNAYGPLFIRLKTDPWKGIGIHGTHDPASIGTDVTEGCVRLHNNDLLEFRELIAVGTKVVISP
jgi:lipoprotein-anchoring transpeptidase ErfK/SrfK